jgi:alkanesulfonate monooxygenase SsuD/methylene tetrahydromethanopterin reductase-like flavin-dependent oxidoreductase (luciferase family)
MLAQEMAVLDHLSGGRLDVMLGAGHRAKELDALGYSRSSRGSRMDEGIEVLLRCWTQPAAVSFSGRHYELTDLVVRPQPLQTPHPPVWVAATSVAAARRAGRFGLHLAASSGGDPGLFDAYRDALVEAGHDPAAARISVGVPTTTTRATGRVLESNQASIRAQA